MKPLAARVWTEPAVFIGLATSIALLVLALATDAELDAALLAGIVAPLASALGIRQTVTPTRKRAAADGG